VSSTLYFSDRLAHAVCEKSNAVMVGLDPRVQQLPQGLQPHDLHDFPAVADSYRRFCCEIIDVVASLVPIVKPQAAFFEQLGSAGMLALGDVIDYAVSKNLLVVVDGKRNDIGTTAEAYAAAYLGRKPQSSWGADALTVSPYLGSDSIEPFTKIARLTGAGIFVLVKTSNPGGKMLQDRVCDGESMYVSVAKYVHELSQHTLGNCGYSDVGAVVGATYPAQLAELRSLMPQTWFLVPGYGAQGGTAKDCAAAFNADGLGAVVNNSRGIIFAYERAEYKGKFAPNNWQNAVAAATEQMIAQLRADTAAGKL
jgi:orotidine-5'-phosphate decarboxylase